MSLLAGCRSLGGPTLGAAITPNVPRVHERYQTEHLPLPKSLDSVAAWHRHTEENWIVGTWKESNLLAVFEARTGRFIGHFGRSGQGMGEFSRPNGISIIDDLAIVVERDNQRVQILRLPSFEPLLVLGADRLSHPYGVAVALSSRDEYRVFVTDNTGNSGDDHVRSVVEEFSVDLRGDDATAKWVRTVTSLPGSGGLGHRESVAVDIAHQRLLVAEESQQHIEVYSLIDGSPAGLLGEGLFSGEPEGIALSACGDAGYWLLTDQAGERTGFHVVDRETLEFVGSFAGDQTFDTDGIAFAPSRGGRECGGTLFAVDRDSRISAFAWSDISAALGLKLQMRRARRGGNSGVAVQ